MASVEIVRGIASGAVERQESKSRGPLFGFGWFSKNNAKQGKSKSRQVPADSPLGFTAYRKPPVYVGGSSVLVQVWAVGLDGVDARLVGVHPPPSKQPSPETPQRAEEKSAGKRPVPLGYIPGRSFVGRILEVGWDVDEHALKKGEWVIGLNSVQKVRITLTRDLIQIC
jgi:NADPH:quinone reductase-like Zn-dependent oxidoreductase